jgi:hypothetical protein
MVRGLIRNAALTLAGALLALPVAGALAFAHQAGGQARWGPLVLLPADG